MAYKGSPVQIRLSPPRYISRLPGSLSTFGGIPVGSTKYNIDTKGLARAQALKESGAFVSVPGQIIRFGKGASGLVRDNE